MTTNTSQLTTNTEGAPSSFTLSEELSKFVSDLFLMGHHDNEAVTEMVCDWILEPDKSAVAKAVDLARASFLAAKATRPATMDCDRLDAAFAALKDRGIVVLKADDCMIQADPTSVEGICWFRSEDIDRALEGGGLWLSFGPLLGGSASTYVRVGRKVCEELKRAGLRVKWNGSSRRKIQLPDFVWQKR